MHVNTSYKHNKSAANAAPGGVDAAPTLDMGSPVPLYSQLRELLRQRILDGVYQSHQQLPSELELVARFTVSRITVRQALNDLQREGLTCAGGSCSTRSARCGLLRTAPKSRS